MATHFEARTKALRGQDRAAPRPTRLTEAIKMVKENATAKFNESIDVAVNLGVDAKKSDQTVRGSLVLPQGTGKTVRVAVFTQGEAAKAAKAAGRRHRRPGRLGCPGQGRQDRVRCRYRIARCHAGSGPAWSDSRPARSDAQPQGGYRDPGRRRRRSRTPRRARSSSAPTRAASSNALSAAPRSPRMR